MKKLSILLATLVFAVSSQAAVVSFYDLRGSTVQNALHFLNEPAVASGGTGGEIGLGIALDDNGDADPNTNTLLLIGRVGWGSSQGFTDLSSAANNSHLHGPTAGNNGGGGFTQTAGVNVNLSRSSSLATGGQFTNNPLYTAAQVAELNNGRHYINIHTTNNGGGEIRAFLVLVPEPASAALLGVAGLVVLGRRRRS